MAEGQRWADSVNAWENWADGMASPADRINRPLLDLAGVQSGQHVLDVAAGVGEPSLSLSQMLRDGGSVVASDLVPAMLVALRRRARAHLHPPLPVAADMGALPFADGIFDRALCRFGLMFVPDIIAALAEMRRVLRPGGAAAIAVWGPRADNTLFNRLGMRLEADYGATAVRLLAPLFRFADPAALLAAAGQAGFTSIRHVPLSLLTPARADLPFWLPTLEMAFSPLLSDLTPDARAALHGRIARDFAADADDTERVPVALSVHLLRLGT